VVISRAIVLRCLPINLEISAFERAGTCLRSVASVYRSAAVIWVYDTTNPFLPEDFASVPDHPSSRKRLLHLVCESAGANRGSVMPVLRSRVRLARLTAETSGAKGCSHSSQS
jgi:hypothetical protein